MLGILFTTLIIGVCLTLFQTYVPVAQPIKSLIVAIVVIILIFWILDATGIMGSGPGLSYHHRLFC